MQSKENGTQVWFRSEYREDLNEPHVTRLILSSQDIGEVDVLFINRVW